MTKVCIQGREKFYSKSFSALNRNVDFIRENAYDVSFPIYGNFARYFIFKSCQKN